MKNARCPLEQLFCHFPWEERAVQVYYHYCRVWINVGLTAPRYKIAHNCSFSRVRIFAKSTKNGLVHFRRFNFLSQQLMNPYCIALVFRGSLILRISRVWNHSRNYFSEYFDTSKLSHIGDVLSSAFAKLFQWNLKKQLFAKS